MILGIDLGTTYSVGAYINKNKEVCVIDNAEGSELTPSVVYVEDKSHTIVGENAKDSAVLEPECVISCIKNEMGKHTVVLEREGIEYTPEIISSLILKKIVTDAQIITGEKVEGLVITVPAYFKDSQRKATEDAATILGLPLIGMINEPTAAALCYIRQNHISNEKILIYDLGGGTFDVTILDVKDEKNINVISTDGLSRAGGSYFDKEIVDLVCKRFKEEHGIDLNGADYRNELQDIYIKAEKVKKELSFKDSASIALRVGFKRSNIVITRDEFNDIVKPTCEKTIRKIAQALDNANLSKNDLNRVIMIGGSSRIPYIRDEVSKYLNKEISLDINPDEAVAIGAAVYADIHSNGSMHFTDVCSHSIGVVVINQKGREENEKVILKNTHLPTEKTRHFKTINDGQKSIILSVTEGEYRELSDVTIIGDYEIELPPRVPKGTAVDIKLSLDRHQLVHITLSLPDFGISEEYHMKRNSNMDDEKIQDAATEFGMEIELSHKLQKLIDELDKLTGLSSVKEQVKKRVYSLEADRRAKAAGALRAGGNGTLHLLFTGNPGTGKTTIARMLGKMYKTLGVLPNGDNVVECTRGNLIGIYQGQSAKNVQEKFDEAKGGILFIDEAYSLCIDDRDTFGFEAVNEIVAQMENRKDEVMVIAAGYKKEMEEFLKSNSGLASRFRNRIEFEDYTVDEMCAIFEQFCTASSMILSRDAKEPLYQYIEVQSKAPDFGNARGVRNLFDEVREVQNERLLRKDTVSNVSAKEYDTITAADIEAAAGRRLEREKSLEDLLAELDSLIGLASAKRKVQEMVDAIQVRNMMKERGIETDDNNGTLHLIFKGNAGTGKTTVARLLGKIYTKLGVLKKNTFIEVSRGDLVGNYMGQTATKVLEKIEEADGGILFIDEAYSLNNGEHDEFGREAIQTLVAELENRRDSLMCIVAGYGPDMDKFLAVNQGLASRLSNEVIFEDYTIDEMVMIFKEMARDRGLILDISDADIFGMISRMKENKRDFGNARGVRNALDSCIRNKDSRVAANLRSGREVSDEELVTLTIDDII